MQRSIPIVPTVVVLIAVGIMIRLGFWQLDRMHQKEAMLARFEAAGAMAGEVPWTSQLVLNDAGGAVDLRKAREEQATFNNYRRSRLNCLSVGAIKSVSGQNAGGSAGYVHVAQCGLSDGSQAPVVLGWSQGPEVPKWDGGQVTGIIAPGPRLVADPPLAGLQPNARPNPNDIPNNHLSYAVQWFLFAGVALVIYALALRKRLRG